MLDDDWDISPTPCQDKARIPAGETPAKSGGNPEATQRSRLRTIWGLVIGFLGLLGQGLLYVLSRFIQVPIPRVQYADGMVRYTWRGDWTGRSYRYFIQTYDVELLSALFWIFLIVGFSLALIRKETLQKAVAPWGSKKKRRQAGNQKAPDAGPRGLSSFDEDSRG